MMHVRTHALMHHACRRTMYNLYCNLRWTTELARCAPSATAFDYRVGTASGCNPVPDPSPFEHQIPSGKGLDTISNSNTYQLPDTIA